MPVEIALWRVRGDQPVRLPSTGVPLESTLESLIEADSEMLGTPMLIVGRQVPIQFGTFIDLLSVDGDGTVHVLELKRNRTTHEVVAQALYYGSWVQALRNEDIREIFDRHHSDVTFDQAFAEKFGAAGPPDELNAEHQLTVIASELDTATERIVRYLNTTYGVPINVMFFRYFDDDGRSYLARTWLIEESQPTAPGGRNRSNATKEPWNGLDWFVSFGDDANRSRSWDDARYYGFVSAGGGDWFSRTIRKLPVGARVWVHIPKNGYFGVGTVTAEAMPANDAVLCVNGDDLPLEEINLAGRYKHDGQDEDGDRAEYIVPVEWKRAVPRERAVWKVGFFANQNSACKLRNKFTLDELAESFDVDL